MLNILTVVALFAAAGLLGWWGLRLRWRNRIARWTAAGVAGVVALACIAAGGLIVAGLARFYQRSAPVAALTVEATPQRLARGAELAATFCATCHAPPGSLPGTFTGGVDIGQDLPVPVGALVSGNLTPAGAIAGWSDGELARAIRNAVDADGRWLIIMSYTNAGKLSDEDLASVVAYLRSLPAAGAPTASPLDRLNPMGAAMLGAGMLPSGNPVRTAAITAPPRGATRAWGEYILSYQDCRACHGADLRGGIQGQIPPIGPGLSLVKPWTLQGFITAMRTGIDPDRHQIQAPMPWRQIGGMSDDDLQALYEALQALPD